MGQITFFRYGIHDFHRTIWALLYSIAVNLIWQHYDALNCSTTLLILISTANVNSVQNLEDLTRLQILESSHILGGGRVKWDTRGARVEWWDK